MEIKPNAVLDCLYHDLSRYLDPYQLSIARETGGIWPDATPKQVAAVSIARSLLKKFEAKNTADIDALAFNKFLESNKLSKDWRPQLAEVWHEELLGSFKQELYNFWFVGTRGGHSLIQTDQDVLAESNTGPGSAIGARGEDFYTKLFDSPLSCTSQVLYWSYRSYCNKFPSLFQGELLRASWHGTLSIRRESRLTFVPKNDTISRSICVEPNLNVLFQLGCGAILSRRLRSYFGIDLEVQQERNRILARRGSKRSLDLYGTIDLESASDSISRAMLVEYLPKEFLFWLDRYRTTHVETPRGVEELGMISSMGNGFTFPLQTILFSSMVVAVYKSLGLQVKRPTRKGTGNFGVNGDDIVVRRSAVPRLLWLLGYLGFRVNTAKSFVKGPFRESCGGDYYNGHSVRGVYIKRWDTEQARYVVINRLSQFSARTGIFLPTLVRYFTRRVSFRRVPWWEDDSAGIKTLTPGSLKRASRYQSREYIALVPPQYALTVWPSTIEVPPGERRRHYNPFGLLYAVLHGSVRRNRILLRHEGDRWRKVRRIAPSWDYAPAPPQGSEKSFGGVPRWSLQAALLAHDLG